MVKRFSSSSRYVKQKKLNLETMKRVKREKKILRKGLTENIFYLPKRLNLTTFRQLHEKASSMNDLDMK